MVLFVFFLVLLCVFLGGLNLWVLRTFGDSLFWAFLFGGLLEGKS